MGNAIANLQARLAKGGGTADDWELLAKSYEFLGRPQEAAKARAHQLPLMPRDDDSAAAEPVRAPANAPASAPGKSVSGEVSLAATLSAKAAAGATLFIVAKSVDSPGPPVAVFRGSVGTWPVNFTLDDSQSMLPGRNLSNAGRVTIEARISRSGQPLPAAGDLQGSSGVINPADRQPLKIIINKVIT
jgi:cytochrome c-type biogenesis protein CcmH